MTLRASELLDVCREVAARGTGRAVQKVVQPSAHAVALALAPTATEAASWLFLSVDARSGRLHFDERPPSTGEAAPAFCMLLRKELVGARLSGVEAVLGERACALHFLRSDGPRSLLAFFFGAGARLVLVDASGQALGAIGPGRQTPMALPNPRADPERAPSRFPSERPSAAIASHYHAIEEAASRTAALQNAERDLQRRRARIDRRQAALKNDLVRVEATFNFRRNADLILAHLAEVPRGASEVTLPNDFEGGAPIAIALDPALDAKANAARLYREHKRLSRGRQTIEARLAQTVAERASIDALLERLARGELPEISPRPKKAQRPSATQTSLPFRRFRSASGSEILVGKGAAHNDALTFGVARGSDLWLHVRDAPGAHVVVPLARDAPIDSELLVDAATLAAHHSALKNESQVDVTYALRKQVRKPKGAPVGAVSISGGKTLRVRMEPERVTRLLTTLAE